MHLLTALPARKDGTLKVAVPDGTAYVFSGMPLGCDVQDEEHLDHLQALGFMSQDDFEAEQDFQRRNAEREAKRAARSLPAQDGAPIDEDGLLDAGDGVPVEGHTPATGRVRRARK